MGELNSYSLVRSYLRAVAPSPAGPAMAGPVFAAGTKILNIEDMHSKHTLKLGGGTGLRLSNVLKAEWSCYNCTIRQHCSASVM